MSAPTDRELLELAAKAAGYEVYSYQREAHEVWGEYAECLMFDGCEWNPLTDDREALRLAVDLNMRVSYLDFSGYAIAQCRRPDGPEVQEYCGPQPKTDPYKAMRRAIVMAAAALQTAGGKP